MPSRTAKVFTNGGSQAIRLPAEFRFDVDEVYIRRDERTGDVVLSARPRTTWLEFMALRSANPPKPGELSLEREQPAATDRDPFAGWPE